MHNVPERVWREEMRAVLERVGLLRELVHQEFGVPSTKEYAKELNRALYQAAVLVEKDDLSSFVGLVRIINNEAQAMNENPDITTMLGTGLLLYTTELVAGVNRVLLDY